MTLEVEAQVGVAMARWEWSIEGVVVWLKVVVANEEAALHACTGRLSHMFLDCVAKIGVGISEQFEALAGGCKHICSCPCSKATGHCNIAALT